MHTNLYEKEVQSLEDLIDLSEDGLSIYSGKNNLSTLNNDSKVIIVGSFIPQRLVYFYNENSYIYEAIDVARGTHLLKYKKKYPSTMDPFEKEKIVDEIKEILSQQKIAFIDLFEKVLIKTDSSKDKDIKGFVCDHKAIGILYELQHKAKIVSVTEDVEKILLDEGIGNRYIKNFPGRSDRYPKGTDYKKEWIDVFKVNDK